MKFKFVLIAALLMFAIPALAQDFGSVSGLVTIGDNAISGANITFTPRANNGQPRSTQSGRDGHYSMVQMVATSYNASCDVDNRRMVIENVQVVANHNTEVNFHFEANQHPGGIEGTVTSPDGDVLADVEVGIVLGDNRRATHTNGDGYYSFGNVAVGEYTVTGAKQGYQAFSGRTAVHAGEVTEFNFEMQPNQQDEVGGVAGTVTDPDGAPIANAEVALTGDGGNNGGGFRAATHTNEHGQYAFENVPVGEYTITAGKAGYQAYSGRLAVRADEVTERNIVLEPNQHDEVGSVAGMVSDTDRNPLAGAEVVLVGAHNNQRFATHTNERGQYGFENIPVGVYMGRASKDGYNPREARVEVNANNVTVVNFTLEAGGNNGGEHGRIIGLVINPDRAPIAGADVLVVAHVNDHVFRFLTHTGERGMFEINNIPVGVAAITVTKLNYRQFNGEIEVVADQAANVTITLEPANHDDDVVGSVGGTVTDDAGHAIELALVVISGIANNDHHRGGHQYSAQTDGEGHYVIENVLVGAYSARASKLHYRAAESRLVVEENARTEANFVLNPEDENGGGNHHGGDNDRPGDTLVAHGTAIVIAGDAADIYLLDADNDGAADYILYFGAPDFDPGNGATRPEDGDEIDIVGLVIGHMQPPLVVVLEINGQTWRANDRGNGGEPGGGNGWEDAENLQLIEAEGTVHISDPHGPWYHRYFLDTTDDGHVDYRLFFGEDDYDPGNGATRPENEDFISLVGGMFQPREGLPVIVVYEINGQFWRDPADTMQLFWQLPDEVKDLSTLPVSIALMRTFPNPFNPEATVSVTLPERMNVRLTVVDAMGREVAVIADADLPAGNTQMKFDGSKLNAGTYFIMMDTGKMIKTERITLLK